MATDTHDGGDVTNVPAMRTADAPKDNGGSKPSPKPRPKRRSATKRKQTPSHNDGDATFIVGHDGKRQRTEDYFSADKPEPTFIVGHDGKRVKSEDYRTDS